MEELRTFDPMGRLLTMTTTNSVNGESFAMEYEYDAVGSALEQSPVFGRDENRAATDFLYPAGKNLPSRPGVLLSRTEAGVVIRRPVQSVYQKNIKS